MLDQNHLVMPSTCLDHGTAGFTNFAARKAGGMIEFESHAGGGCVVRVPEDQAIKLRDKLNEWL